MENKPKIEIWKKTPKKAQEIIKRKITNLVRKGEIGFDEEIIDKSRAPVKEKGPKVSEFSLRSPAEFANLISIYSHKVSQLEAQQKKLNKIKEDRANLTGKIDTTKYMLNQLKILGVTGFKKLIEDRSKEIEGWSKKVKELENKKIEEEKLLNEIQTGLTNLSKKAEILFKQTVEKSSIEN